MNQTHDISCQCVLCMDQFDDKPMCLTSTLHHSESVTWADFVSSLELWNVAKEYDLYNRIKCSVCTELVNLISLESDNDVKKHILDFCHVQCIKATQSKY